MNKSILEKKTKPDDIYLPSLAILVRILPGIQMAFDVIILLISSIFSYRLFGNTNTAFQSYYVFAVFFNCIMTIILLYFSGLYQFLSLVNVWRALDRIIISVATTMALLLSAAFTLKISGAYPRLWVGALMGSCLFGLVAGRSLMAWFIHFLGKNGRLARKIVVFGSGLQAEELTAYLADTTTPFMKIVGVFLETSAIPCDVNEETSFEALVRFTRTHPVDDIIVAMPWAAARDVAAVVDRLRELPINVFLSVNMAGFRVAMRPAPQYFERLPIVQVASEPLSGWNVVIKTIEDYVLASALLVLVSPVMLAAAILVRLDSPGPILFRQRRLGFNNQVFDIFKFRSMRVTQDTSGVTVQARPGDARVTQIGKFLRRTSIDELPQLFNVLNGTMSLVGPRPHAVDHNEDYARKIRGYFARHRMKPGLTGLAQVRGLRGPTDTVEKMEGRVQCDLEYMENWTPLLDLKILVLTPFQLAFGKNAV